MQSNQPLVSTCILLQVPKHIILLSASVSRLVLLHTMSRDRAEGIWDAFMSRETPARLVSMLGTLTQMIFNSSECTTIQLP